MLQISGSDGGDEAECADHDAVSQQDAPRRDQGRRQQGGTPCQGRDEGKSGGGGVDPVNGSV